MGPTALPWGRDASVPQSLHPPHVRTYGVKQALERVTLTCTASQAEIKQLEQAAAKVQQQLEQEAAQAKQAQIQAAQAKQAQIQATAKIPTSTLEAPPLHFLNSPPIPPPPSPSPRRSPVSPPARFQVGLFARLANATIQCRQCDFARLARLLFARLARLTSPD